VLGGAGFFDDPYGMYARIIAGGKPVFDSASDSWVVGGYAQVDSLLRDARMSKRIRREVSTPFDQSVLFRDAPDHGRTRNVMNQAFTGGLMSGMEARVLAIADRLIDRMQESRTADFLDAFAVPLPVAVIAEMLGIPVEQRANVHLWSSGMILEEGAAVEESHRRQYEALCAMEGCIRGLLREGGPVVEAGLIGALAKPMPSGERMTEEELIGNCILLLVAGHETTVNLLGNGLRLLLERPALLAQVRGDSRLLGAFVEETLRYESPVQRGTFRVTTEAIEIGGTTIEAGQQVSALIGAANRDPAVFAEPERFDPARVPNPHLAFGLGPHRCVGAMLARMEARIAFARLLERLPKLRLGGDAAETGWLRGAKRLLGLGQEQAAPRWRHNGITRGLRRLDVTY
jgi:cytochrome P450